MSEHHTILGGKVHIYKRPNSPSWQCASYLGGKNRRTTTKEDSLSKAKEFAEDWYLQLRGKLRDPTYARGQHARTNGHLIPFFGSMVLPEITAGKVNEYRICRLDECKALRGKPPAHNTMHQEIVTLRQIFKTALRHGWIDHLPDLSEPYRSSPKFLIEHGSHRKSTSSFTRRRENAPSIRSSPASVGKRSNYMIMFFSPPILVFVQMKHCVFSFAMSRWLKMREVAKPS